MNKMNQLCDILGVKLFDKFNIVRTIPNTYTLVKLRNPYYFQDEGLINSSGVLDNALIANLVNGSMKIEKLNENLLDTPINV